MPFYFRFDLFPPNLKRIQRGKHTNKKQLKTLVLCLSWKCLLFPNIANTMWVVYGHSSSHICGGAVRCYRKSRDRKWRDRKWRQSRDRKWHQSRALSGGMFCASGSCTISALVWPFDRKWRQSRDRKICPVRKWPWPEVDSAHAQLFRTFFFLLVVVTWLPDVTKGHLIPFGVPSGVRNRKLCNNRSSSKQCWLGCSLFFWYCEDLLIIPDLKYLYCDMNYLFNPYMSKKSYFSK